MVSFLRSVATLFKNVIHIYSGFDISVGLAWIWPKSDLVQYWLSECVNISAAAVQSDSTTEKRLWSNLQFKHQVSLMISQVHFKSPSVKVIWRSTQSLLRSLQFLWPICLHSSYRIALNFPRYYKHIITKLQRLENLPETAMSNGEIVAK